MGLIILPFLFVALTISTIAIIFTIKLLMKKQVGIKELFLGFLTTMSIFAVILLSYKIAGSAWALSTCFVIPIFMIFLPFGIYLIIKIDQNQKLKYLSIILLISVGISGILATIFYDAFFEFFDFIGIEKTY